ncbi:MAG TPA: hypothetical protein VF680_15710 [Allosphingosinicella sp.]|jgi:hypothetical protein
MTVTPVPTDQRASVVLDNALLFSAANLHVRNDGAEKVRNVNLLGLSALVDALVMHQRLTIDRRGWDYFAEAVPTAWLPSIQPMVDVLDFDLPPQAAVAEAVADSTNAVLLAYALTSVDRMVETEEGRDLILTYFSYTGSDLGSNREEQELVSLLKDRLAIAIPDMHLHLRNYEHVSVLQSLVRVCQYQSFASGLGQAYVPHDFRGSIINILLRDRVQPAFRLAWEKLMGVMSDAIKKEYDEKLAWARPVADESFALWERFAMPTFLAMALARTDKVDDLFHHVGDIRNKAQDLRHLLDQFTDVDTTVRGDAIANDVRRVAHELASAAPTKAASIFSVAVGLPPSVSLKMNLPSVAARKSVAFVRDIYDNHAVPLTLAGDVERVFGSVTQPLALSALREIKPGENVLERFLSTARFKATGELLVGGA